MHSALPAGGNGQAAIPLSPQPTESVALVAPSRSPQASSEKHRRLQRVIAALQPEPELPRFHFRWAENTQSWGGLQIAQTVLNYCRRYPLGTAAPATMSTERAAAMSALVTRCDMSKEEKCAANHQIVFGLWQYDHRHVTTIGPFAPQRRYRFSSD